MPDLNQGRWRQVALFPNVTAPLVGHGYRPDLLCVTSSYEFEEEGYLVTNIGFDKETQEEAFIFATLDYTNDNLLLQLDPILDLPEEVYQVLDTDYVSYASVWNCKEFPMFGILVRREFAWILAREEVIEDRTLKNAIEAYKRFGIDVEQFDISNHRSC